MLSFKDEISLEERIQESSKLMKKWTGRIPIVVEKQHNCSLPEGSKKKYVVLPSQTIHLFMERMRRSIRLSESSALFLFVNETVMVTGDQIFGVLYEKYKDEDGFLYLKFSDQEVKG